MFPAKFDYLSPTRIDVALEILANHDDVKILAGGHSLLPLMKLRLATPLLLVDISKIEALSFIEDRGTHLAIGSLTLLADIVASKILTSGAPLLVQIASQVGDPAVRHRATIGGSIVHGDCAGDLPAAMLALGATFVMQGPMGERRIRAVDFFTGFLETAIFPSEILTYVLIDKFSGSWFYEKFNRRAQDWAIVGVAVLREETTRIALINMSSTPVRAFEAEKALQNGATGPEASMLVATHLDPPADSNATSEFRRHLAQVITRRALEAVS